MEKLENVEFKGQTHEQASKLRRKLLQEKILSKIEPYDVYNGLAITSMLSRLQDLFDDHREELAQELEDQDYDDLGTCELSDIFKTMKMNGINPETMDEELREFMLFLAMRVSNSLAEVDYKEFVKVFEPGYNLIENPSIWEKQGEDPYEKSSDDGELKTESSVEQKEEEEEAENQQEEQVSARKDSEGNYEMD